MMMTLEFRLRTSRILGGTQSALSELMALEKEVAILEAHSRRQLSKGDAYYLCTPSWFSLWKTYVTYSSNNLSQTTKVSPISYFQPGPIETKGLLDENGKLKSHMIADFDFFMFFVDDWDALVSMYGLLL